MYIIKQTTEYRNGSTAESYFTGTGLWGIVEYSTNARNAKQFSTKKEAQNTIRDTLPNSKYRTYEIIKVGDQNARK